MKWKCNVCDAINDETDKKCWNCRLMRAGNEAVVADEQLDLRGKSMNDIFKELDKIAKKVDDKKKWN